MNNDTTPKTESDKIPTCDIPVCKCATELPPCPNCGCRSKQIVYAGDSGRREEQCWKCSLSTEWAGVINEKVNEVWQQAEAYGRADERAKVIAELRKELAYERGLIMLTEMHRILDAMKDTKTGEPTA